MSLAASFLLEHVMHSQVSSQILIVLSSNNYLKESVKVVVIFESVDKIFKFDRPGKTTGQYIPTFFYFLNISHIDSVNMR